MGLAISRSCHGLWLTDGRSTTHSGKSRVNYNKITYSQHGSDLESHGPRASRCGDADDAVRADTATASATSNEVYV